MVAAAGGLYVAYWYIGLQEDQAERQEHAYLIESINNFSAERQTSSLQQTKTILNNMSNMIRSNGELIGKVIEAQNITVIVGEHEDAHNNETLYAELLKKNESKGTGTISGFGEPIIIK